MYNRDDWYTDRLQRDPNDPDTHRDEGFLKSLWHTLTNHPAHQKPNEDGSQNDGSTKKPGDDDKK